MDTHSLKMDIFLKLLYPTVWGSIKVTASQDIAWLYPYAAAVGGRHPWLKQNETKGQRRRQRCRRKQRASPMMKMPCDDEL